MQSSSIPVILETTSGIARPLPVIFETTSRIVRPHPVILETTSGITRSLPVTLGATSANDKTHEANAARIRAPSPEKFIIVVVAR